MKKIKIFLMMLLAVLSFAACDDDDNDTKQNVISEYSYNDGIVKAQKAKSGKDKAVLLVAFGSTWTNAFAAFDKTKEAYEQAFPDADVYFCFSSDICINRASAGEHGEKRDYYEPRYLLHAIGAAKYNTVYVQSLQVIPGEEFANVVAAVKKFANNGYVSDAHLDDEYLKEAKIYLGMPLLNNQEEVDDVAKLLNDLYKEEAAKGVVAFMGHGNPDNYDSFKANVRYTQLENALQVYSKNYYVGTVDMKNNYKQNVLSRMSLNGKTSGEIRLHALMSIAGDHAHNDMAGVGNEYWDASEPTSEDNSWYEFFAHNGFTSIVPKTNGNPLGLLELPTIRQIWINHTKNAELLEDAYHSMYPEE
mgnify:CR=1 FL=1